MLIRLMTDTNTAFLVSTSDAYVFAFGDRVGADEDEALSAQVANCQQSSPP
jgi:hypothetical protein